MKLIFTKNLIPGMCTGEEVISQDGVIKLLAQGIVLNQSQIDSIRNWGLSSIYIEDSAENMKEQVMGVQMTKAEFTYGYAETLNRIVHGFRHIKRFGEVPIAEMNELVDQKIILLVESIGGIAHFNEMRSYSDNTFSHSLNVAVIAGILGKWCNYRNAELKNIILSALLHDIGKLSVPLSILNKPGRLSDEEFAVIKKHPQEGYQMINEDARISNDIKLGIWQHHERLDGSGYPRGLVGNEIFAVAKIISIADAYDAITSERIYHHKKTPLEALDILAEDMFKKLDPVACMTFMEHMENYFIGNSVILSNGQQAKIIGFNTKEKCFTKPLVCLYNGDILNLQKERICIEGIDCKDIKIK